MTFILLHEKGFEHERAEDAEARVRRVFVNTRQIVRVEPCTWGGCRVALAGSARGVYPEESAEDVLALIRLAEAEEDGNA